MGPYNRRLSQNAPNCIAEMNFSVGRPLIAQLPTSVGGSLFVCHMPHGGIYWMPPQPLWGRQVAREGPTRSESGCVASHSSCSLDRTEAGGPKSSEPNQQVFKGAFFLLHRTFSSLCHSTMKRLTKFSALIDFIYND